MQIDRRPHLRRASAAIGIVVFLVAAVMVHFAARRHAPAVMHALRATSHLKLPLPVPPPTTVAVPSLPPSPPHRALRAGAFTLPVPALGRFTLDKLPGPRIEDAAPPWTATVTPEALGLREGSGPPPLQEVALRGPTMTLLPSPVPIESALPEAPARATRNVDVSGVVDALGARRGALTAAYERVLKNDPAASGVVEVRFTVARDGSARDVAVVRDTIGAPALARRVTSVVRSTRFPATEREKTFAYPFVFRPVD